MLSQSNLVYDFWAKAINMAFYLVNRSLSTAIEMKTPIKVWSGIPGDYSIVMIFGYPAYIYVNDSKFEKRAHKYIVLVFRSETKGYRLWCIKSVSQKFLTNKMLCLMKMLCFIRKRSQLL